VNRLWKPNCSLDIQSRENGFIFFRFGTKEECNCVLQTGPWLFDGCLIILKQWSPDIGLERDLLSVVPVWVRFPSLHPKFWSNNFISKIASLIGNPLFMDKATTSFERIAYARRFIQIYANKPLPNAVCLETEGKVNIEVEYDWIPPTCKKCKYFGHVDIHCPTKMSWVPKTHTNEEVKQNQNEGKEKESGVSEEEEKEITNLNKGELESKTSGNPTKEISANANVATVTSAGDTGLKKGNGNYVNSVSEFVPQVEGVVVRASKYQIKTQSSGSGEQIHVADMHADIQTDTLIQKHADADTYIKDQTTNTKHSSKCQIHMLIQPGLKSTLQMKMSQIKRRK